MRQAAGAVRGWRLSRRERFIARAHPDVARLAVCDRAAGSSGVDGAWWPNTRDLSLALPDLLAVVGSWIGPISRVVYDRSKPDGTPQKLLDVGRLAALGWRARTSLREGIALAYAAAPLARDGATADRP